MHEIGEVKRFLLKVYPSAKNIQHLGDGGHAQAYSFSENGSNLVIRFSKVKDDFEKDDFANTFNSPTMHIPKLIKIGSAFDGFYAISEQAFGTMLDDLSHRELLETIPSIFKMLDNLRTTDLSNTNGFGPFDKDGRGKHESWADYLIDSLHDNPNNRIHGWYKIMQESEFGTATFDSGYKLFLKLIKSLPNIRHLYHYDLLNKNVLVKDNKIGAIFDWGCAGYGDFLFELATFSFWAPLIEGYKDFDWKDLAVKHFDSIGLDVPDFDARMQAYELYIGLEHLGYCAFKDDWKNFEEITRLVNQIVAQNALNIPY
jgi:hygromycin-B 4-O-kinase